jgi:tripartite-type tricarboxylate transporter receptor subunit TctC
MNLKLSRRHALALLGAATVPWAYAQSKWPTKPVRIVVPFGAGGVADLTVRAVGDQLAKQLGEAVVIDNKPGAGGIVAGSTVLQAPPDGYTLFLMSNATAVSEGLFHKLPFHARTDFAPISLLGTFDIAVVVAENSRFKSLGDLLAEAKAKPGKLNIATIAAGSSQNLTAELFKMTAGVDVQIVPFNGTPQVVTALRGGEVDAAVEIVAPILSQIQAKALRALATFGEKRSIAMPGVPTANEVGGPLKGLYISSWNALAAPAKTPPDVVARLSHECVVALANPEVKKKLADLGVDAKSSTPQQLAALLDSETKRWGGVIERAKIPKM